MRTAGAVSLCLVTLANVAGVASLSFPEAIAVLLGCAVSASRGSPSRVNRAALTFFWLWCLEGAIGNSTCALTDLDCICASDSLNAATTVCTTASCTVKEALSRNTFPSTLWPRTR